MKQVQQMMKRWIKGVVTTSSMFVFSVSLASGNAITTAPNTATPYSYSDPNSTVPSYNNVGRPVDEETQSLMVNNEALGLSSPVTVSTGYSANYGYEMNASFSHMLGFYDAVSLLGAYAPQENRVDITWAHAWTEKQRTKLSVERLEEAMDFDYDSGSVTEWVPQYAYGAGYQYLFNKNWLKNVELTGYYAQAQSQNLDTIRFTGTDGNLYDNYRHIAGATSKGSEATLNVSPWKTGLVGLGLNYDSVNYDTKYNDTDAENAKGFGFTLSLEQLLSKHVKFDLEGSQREVYDDYVAGVSFLTPSNLEVGVNGERTLGENGSASDSRFNLNLAYFFDDKNRYENGYNLEDPSQNDLASWASKSAAYMDEVLAAADQKTVQVTTAPQSKNPMADMSDTAPVLNLTVGEVNHINISNYIANANLTEAQKQATPVIKGGPSEVGFTYDNATQTLVTTTEVPESVVNKTFEPLVLVFPVDAADETTRTQETLSDVATNNLTFKVAVSSNSLVTNPSFDAAQEAITGRAQSWVFKYQNASNTADPSAMFINTYSSYSKLTMNSGYPSAGSTDPNHCYTFVSDNTAETLTVTSAASDVCPGNATISVETNNGYKNSPVQTITFAALPAGTPVVSGAAITSPAMLENQVYSPGYAFPTTGDTNVVYPGKDEQFSTTAGDNTLLVCNASNNQVVTDSNLELGVAPSQITLQSSAALPSKYVGTTFDIYLSVKNTDGLTANNGTSCGTGTPFTSTVQGAPSIPDNIPLGAMSVDTSYHYDFMTDGGSTYNVTNGSSAITSLSGSTISVKNSSGTEILNGQDLTSTLGLELAQQGNDVVLSGIINPGYVGDTVYVTLNLANEYGTSTNSAAPAFSEAITANGVYAPSVAGGQVLNTGTEGSTYTYTFPNTGDNAVTAGTGEKFDTATSATYATVTDSVTSEDLSSQFSLTFDADATQITLTSGGNTLATQNNINVVLHVANIDGQVADNAANPDYFSIVQPYQPQIGDTGHALTNAVVNGDNSVTYSYTSYASSPMLPGPTDSNETFNTTTTKALVYYATDTAKANPLSGFSLEYNAGNTAITGLTASSATVAGLTGPVNVYYYAVNNDNPNSPVESTTADTIGTDMISVPNSTIASGNIDTAYTYSFKDNGNLITGSTGLSAASTVTFSDPNAGLTAIPVSSQNNGVYDDIQVSGTPVAGHASTLTLTLNLTTPDNLLTQNIPVTLAIEAPAPVVTLGDYNYSPQLNETFTYEFANSEATANGKPVVSAGTGEYFDEAATTVTVTGSDGANETGLFTLQYSNDGTLPASGGNNVVTLVSKDVLSQANTFTVTFDVHNIDQQTAQGSTGSVTVGSQTGYLSCPASAQINSNPSISKTQSSLMNAPTGGSVLKTVTFNGKDTDGNTRSVELYGVTLKVSGNQTTMICNYNNQMDLPIPDYDYISSTTITTVDAQGVQAADSSSSDWKSATQCNVGGAPSDTACQVKYTYAGQ